MSSPGKLMRARMPKGFVAPPDRTVACLPDAGLILLCDAFGELVAQNMAGRVEFVRYATGDALQRSEAGKRYWHKRVTDEQLAIVRAAFLTAARLGKPYANDWSPPARVPWWHPLEREPTLEEFKACPIVSM